MSTLLNQSDITLLENNWDSIIDKARAEANILIEPTLDERKEIQAVILNFVKTKKRKMYGGYALNLLVSSVDKKDAFYKADEVPDIDIYSPDPIVDLMELCNILHEKKFKHIRGTEGLHTETYKLFVNQKDYCDFSYVPKNVYNNMPFKNINGFMLIHPHFMAIDYLRMFTDPLLSWWRNADLKSFKRFFILQKHFPLPQSNSKLSINGSTPEIDAGLNTVFNFLVDRTSTLTIGFYAYNYFLNKSGILDDKKYKIFKLLQVPYFEIISSNYKSDCLELLEKLKNNIAIGKLIKHTEFYPWFQYTGFSTEIYIKKDLIARIYDHNNRCTPYQDVVAYDFIKSKELTSSKIRLGTFDVVLLFALTMIMVSKSKQYNDFKDLYFTTVSHLIEMRNYYLKTNKKTFIDDSIFKEFTIKCCGSTIPPDRIKRLKNASKKKDGKRYFQFSYEPENNKKEASSVHIFLNSSGNEINNPKNLKLVNDLKVVLDNEEEEEEQEPEVEEKDSEKYEITGATTIVEGEI